MAIAASTANPTGCSSGGLVDTDELAERVRKIGGTTLRSIGQIAGMQRVKDNDADFVPPRDMLRELMADNKAFAANLRDAHKIAGENDDVGTSSLLETFVG